MLHGTIPEWQIPSLLMSATGFPFVTPKELKRQLIELRLYTDGTLNGAIAYASKKIDEEMRKLREKRGGISILI